MSKKIATTLDLSGNTINNLGIGSNASDAVNKSQLDLKVTANSPISGGTATKVTYDAKGLITSGANLSSSDIPNIEITQVTDLSNQLATVTNHEAMNGLLGGAANDHQHLTTAQVNKVNNCAYTIGQAESFIPDISVRAVSTANLATLSGPQTVDGIALVAGDFVLLKNQTSLPQNGVYVVNAGAWTRATGWDSDAEIRTRLIICASDGTNNKVGYEFLCNNTAAITVGTTNITFAQVPLGLGAGALNAATGNHGHTSIATSASSSLGYQTRLRYTARTASATTAATDLWVVFSGSTAAQTETMYAGTAVSNNSGVWLRYTNKATVPWTIAPAASNTINGGASFTLPVGYSVDLLNTALNTWVTTYFGKTTVLDSTDIPTHSHANATDTVYGLVQIEDTVINGSTKAITSNAVFDALANIGAAPTYIIKTSGTGSGWYFAGRLSFDRSSTSSVRSNAILRFNLVSPLDFEVMGVIRVQVKILSVTGIVAVEPTILSGFARYIDVRSYDMGGNTHGVDFRLFGISGSVYSVQLESIITTVGVINTNFTNIDTLWGDSGVAMYQTTYAPALSDNSQNIPSTAWVTKKITSDYPAQAGSVSGAVSYNLLRFSFPYSSSYVYNNIIVEISLYASDHPVDMGTMQILLSVSYEEGTFEYSATETYSTAATAGRGRIAFYDNSPTTKNVYIGFMPPSTNRIFAARIVSNANPSSCSILYYTDSSTMGGDVAISQNSIIANKVNKTGGQTDWISASAVETILYIDGGIGFTILDGNGAYNGHVRYEVTSIGGVNEDAMYSAIIDLRIKNQYGVISYSGDLVSGSVNAFDNLWFRYDRVGGICYLTPIFRLNQWTTVNVRTLSEQGNIHSLSFNPTTTTSVSSNAAKLKSPIIRNNGVYTQWEMTGTKGDYTGLSIAGFKRLNLMSSTGAEAFGLYMESPGGSKWMLLRDPYSTEGITTDYPPPSNASGNQIATCAWVRGTSVAYATSAGSANSSTYATYGSYTNGTLLPTVTDGNTIASVAWAHPRFKINDAGYDSNYTISIQDIWTNVRYAGDTMVVHIDNCRASVLYRLTVTLGIPTGFPTYLKLVAPSACSWYHGSYKSPTPDTVFTIKESVLVHEIEFVWNRAGAVFVMGY